MPIQNCDHGSSAPTAVLDRVHDSQAYASGRHQCAVCAYAEGYRQGMQSNRWKCPVRSASALILRNLPPSQAGAQRHKCCLCAFREGFLAGQVAAGV